MVGHEKAAYLEKFIDAGHFDNWVQKARLIIRNKSSVLLCSWFSGLLVVLDWYNTVCTVSIYFTKQLYEVLW